MKRAVLLVAAAILIAPLALVAQSAMEDVIYLESGAVFRGEIIAQDSEAVKIRTAGSNVFVVHREEVERITREERPGRRLYKEQGYLHETHVDVLPGGSGAVGRVKMVHWIRPPLMRRNGTGALLRMSWLTDACFSVSVSRFNP